MSCLLVNLALKQSPNASGEYQYAAFRILKAIGLGTAVAYT